MLNVPKIWLFNQIMGNIENLKHNEMLEHLGQAWQNGSTSAA